MQIIFDILITVLVFSFVLRHVIGTAQRWEQYRMTVYEFKCRKGL